MVTNEDTGELEYTIRMQGNQWSPTVFSDNSFSVKIGEPSSDTWKNLKGLQPEKDMVADTIRVVF